MIWSRLPVLRALFAPAPPTDAAAAACARRWWKAAEREPLLAEDLIRLAGVLVTQPGDGQGDVLPIDPQRLAYEAGRRDMGLQLLAMMSLSVAEMNQLMRDEDGRPRRDHRDD